MSDKVCSVFVCVLPRNPEDKVGKKQTEACD